MNKKFTIWAVVLLSTIHYPLSTHADLAVTATPGFVFSDTASGRPTVANLNRALNFTYAISGSIGGTNAGLSAGSVSGTMLMDSVVDNVTVQFVGSPRGIEVIDGGINIDQINSAIAGNGLGGGSGAALSNKTDNVTLTITNDVLTLATNLSATYLNVASNGVVVGTSTNRGQTVDMQVFARMLATNSFVSAETALAFGSQIINVAHGLGLTPKVVRAVLVCQSANNGYVLGDELDVASVIDFSGSTYPAFYPGANATNVFCAQSSSGTFQACNKTTGAIASLMPLTNWRLKIYARP